MKIVLASKFIEKLRDYLKNSGFENITTLANLKALKHIFF